MNIFEYIKSQINNEVVFRSYLKEARDTGTYIKFDCPFEECKATKGTFTYSKPIEIFYCFSCQNGGDVFTFVGKIGNLSPSETVIYLQEQFPEYFILEDKDFDLKKESQKESVGVDIMVGPITKELWNNEIESILKKYSPEMCGIEKDGIRLNWKRICNDIITYMANVSVEDKEIVRRDLRKLQFHICKK